MLQVEMTAALREVTGKGPMRQLRLQGFTPAVVYGAGEQAVKLQLETKTLMAQLLKYYRRNTLVTLKLEDGTQKNVVIGEVQTDPVKESLIHVDFCEIDLDKERAFAVPVNYEGTAKGVDLGGEMVVVNDTITLQGKPTNIPDEISIDVTALNIGDAVRCGSVPVPENVVMVTEADAVAVLVQKPGTKAELEEEEGEEAVDGEAPEAEETAAEE
jgi:large subunit ribosomal protein L25